ncbi:MAG TPA: mannosyltransferase family protein [Methylomirabilota bacterium]|nr:mannosyltransferase family protein [Methylomirabilota bacterium]
MNGSLSVPMPTIGWRERLSAVVADLRLDGGLVALFVASRLLILVAAFVAEALIPRNPLLEPGADGPILRSLTSWDGWFYLGIVRDGYQAAPVSGDYVNIAFPPLYPMLIRFLSWPIPGSEGIVAILISNVAFIGALALLVRLGTPYLGRRRATIAAGLLIIYPFASVFAMAYTESLFLLLMVAAFLAAERGHRAWAGIFLALTVLCRLQGIALILPLLIVMLRQDGWRLRASQAWLLLGPLAGAAFLAYIATVTGATTAFLDAQQAWGRDGIGGAAPTGTIAAMFTPYQGALILTLLASCFLLIFRRVDRLRVEYFLVPVLFIAAELSSGSLEAVGRITMLAFPLVWILANRRSSFARRGWPMVSVGLFAIVAVLQFGGYWVP